MKKSDLSLENWKDVEGYEGLYLISDHGRVMSVRRHRENGNSGYYQESKILKPSKTTTGYWKIELYKNNKKKSFKIHRLVAKHFIANPYNKPEVNHIDGNKLNNKVGNLEWVTRQENVNHAVDNNLRETFSINKASLTELYIGKNMSPNEIAALFGISRGPIDEHIEKYGIKKEVSTKYGITEKQLKTSIQLGKTNKEIAEEIGCDPSLISHYKNRIERTGKIYG